MNEKGCWQPALLSGGGWESWKKGSTGGRIDGEVERTKDDDRQAGKRIEENRSMGHAHSEGGSVNA